MTTALITHAACLDHDTGPGHAERIERLEAVLAALDDPAFAALLRHEARAATPDELARVHPRAYVDATLAAVPAFGHRALDPDTILSPGSGEAALRAAGAVMDAVDLVVAGRARNAFCAVRPPGHHAEPDRAMGFCLFNNIAVGAHHARAVHGLQRVAVVDFDVHHGNGSETLARRDPDFFYASTHQWPLYPGTGADDAANPANLVNRPLDPGSGSGLFRAAYTDTILPALAAFKPDLILISAGFDAHERDPLAGLTLHEEDFAWVTAALCALAADVCDGRVVSALEGGYDLTGLAQSAVAHVAALMAAS